MTTTAAQRNNRTALITAIVGAAMLALAFLGGYVPRRARQAALARDTAAAAAEAPRVVTVTPTLTPVLARCYCPVA